jgi:hypothetical protein
MGCAERVSATCQQCLVKRKGRRNGQSELFNDFNEIPGDGVGGGKISVAGGIAT